MRFKKLNLYTAKLEEELEFYSQTLGFELLDQTDSSFTVKVGWTALTFERTEQHYIYHYCFLIPSNKLHQAKAWMQQRIELFTAADGSIIQNFEDWNANSFYFYDASGNVAECIVRYDLDNNTDGAFEITDILCVNEMGIPTKDISKTNSLLEQGLETTYYKGNLTRFGTNGSLEGIFLLPNYEVKDTWFPTPKKIKPHPFEAVIDNREKLYKLIFDGEQIETALLATIE